MGDEGGGRVGSVASAADMITNAVMVAGIELGQAGYALQPGKYPWHLMPSLLHETAHWETFSSPVGGALSSLFLRAWKNTQGTKSDSDEAALDYTRYSVFNEMLRPLCEGLALFTEFDSVPGDSPVTTTATMLAAMLFGGDRDAIPPGMTLGNTAELNLSEAREDRLMITRKENLLGQDFNTENGGYLPGYHFVRNLRYNLVSRRGLTSLIDGDLYFWIVKAVIFGDLKLARLIIDADLDVIITDDEYKSADRDAINAVLKRFQELLVDCRLDLTRDCH